ncbi:MAG: hypothetical protein NDI69_06845 [Bacteriovoracaceae bacterium]|nr:hypothetical protein [Bacteriovoracaceae bacterium]
MLKIETADRFLQRHYTQIDEYIQQFVAILKAHPRLSKLENLSVDSLLSLDLFKTLSSQHMFLLSASQDEIYIFIEKLGEHNMHIMYDINKVLMPHGDYSSPSIEDLEESLTNAPFTKNIIVAITFYNNIADETIIFGVPLTTILNSSKISLAS